ncbi:DNA cytosine methyltransferase [Sulfuriferula sp. GW1]|uniref:DNA cytosine methyltransferase n=1 Tax=Sulfuriferula sp. GW1 TaxID=3345111 RepID=UPI0039B09A7C
MKAISLFSGGGGMDFAARSLGIDVLFANDVIPETELTFASSFPETDFHLEDIRQISKFPSVDLVTGGYPCQSFSLGGNRNPANDPRTFLFKEFARVVDTVKPKYFVAENVSGLKSIQDGNWLKLQLDTYNEIAGVGYNIATAVVNARDYGVPQRRKRVIIVGVRKDLGVYYHFPKPTHAKPDIAAKKGLLPYASHGEAIRHLPLDVPGEYYERPHDPEGNFSWYYMSRNRKASWLEPSYTIVANFRHTTLHPASPTMKLLWSNLADGWKQKWEFSSEYEHLLHDPTLPVLEKPRRLSWREAALIQTFPEGYEPAGKLEKKFEQIGNAVPPMLMRAILQQIVSGEGLLQFPSEHEQYLTVGKQLSLLSEEQDIEPIES